MIIDNIFCVIVLLTLSAASGLCAGNDWTIIPGSRVGPINSKTTESELIRLYGKENVLPKSICIDRECGESELGSIIFPNNSEKSLGILWKDKKRRRFPERVDITGSKWKTKEGISLGTDLRMLERSNGRAFTLMGMGWDYGGLIISWENGKLAKYYSKHFLIIICERPNVVSWEEEKSINGDIELLSSNKVLQKMNPTICEISMDF